MNQIELRLEDLTESIERNAPRKVVVSIEYPYYISVSSIEECDKSRTNNVVLNNELCLGHADDGEGYSWNDYYNACGTIEFGLSADEIAQKFWSQVAEGVKESW